MTITATANNKRGPRFCEQAFANLSTIPFNLFVLPLDGTATLAVRCHAKQHHTIIRELQASYPDLRIQKRRESVLQGKRYRVFLSLIPDYFLLRTLETFRNDPDGSSVDPVSSLLSAIAPSGEFGTYSIEFQCRPYSKRQTKRFARRCAAHGAPEKATHSLYHCRVIVTGTHHELFQVVKRQVQEMAAVFLQFTSGTPTTFKRAWKWRAWFTCTNGELATLWHPPTDVVKAAAIETNDSRSLEAPQSIGSGKESGGVLLGTNTLAGRQETFGIKREDRRRHMAIVGKTGMGKSTLLQQMIFSDMEAGHGVGLIDPHGDLAEDVLRLVPRHRTGDVVLIDAGDQDNPPAFDPLHCGQGSDASLTASGVTSAFKKLYGDSWGPRLEYTLRNAVLALVEVPDASMMSLMRMLSDKGYRETLLTHVQDPLVRSFWIDEFAKKPVKLQEETVAPIQNKVGQFLSSPLLRNIVGQVPGKIDLRQVMDGEKILIVNLSKGLIGEDSSTLLGALLVTALQQTAMSRSDIPQEERKDFFLYVDEFQNFATDSFATILSEARKFRLCLTVANQYFDQMEEKTRQAVFGNVGSLLSFQIGTTDAELLAPQMGGDLSPLDLMSLPQYQAYIRLLVDGMPSKPFSMKTIPPKANRGEDRTDKIRRTSNRQYSRPKAAVVAELRSQMGHL